MCTDAHTHTCLHMEQLPSPGCSLGTLTGCSSQSPAMPEPTRQPHRHGKGPRPPPWQRAFVN